MGKTDTRKVKRGMYMHVRLNAITRPRIYGVLSRRSLVAGDLQVTRFYDQVRRYL